MLLSNFGMTHVHLENEVQTRTLEQSQVFDACPGAYADVFACQSMVDEKSRGAACAVARNFGLTSVGVDQPDCAISFLPLAGAFHQQPAVCADPGVPIANRTRQTRKRLSRSFV